jgi:hypothetical protein
MTQPGLYFGVTTQRGLRTGRWILFRNTPAAKLCKSQLALFAAKTWRQTQWSPKRTIKTFIINGLRELPRQLLPTTEFCATVAS